MNWLSNIRANTIKSKVLLVFSTVIVVVVVVLIVFTGINRLSNALTQAQSIALEKARSYANIMKSEFDEPMNMSIDMVEAITTIKDNTTDSYQRRELIVSYLKNVLDDENQYSSVFTVWEPNALDDSDSLFSDTEGNNFTGRFMPNIIKDEKGTITVEAMPENTDIQGEGNYYLLPKKNSKPYATNPVSLTFEGRENRFVIFSVPVVYSGVFHGVAGVTMPLSKIQLWIEQNLPAKSHVTLIGHNGQIIADNKDAENAGKSIKSLTDDWRDIMKAKNNEVEFSYYEGKEDYMLDIFVPFRVTNTSNIWGVRISISLEEYISYAIEEILYTTVIGILLLLFSVLIIALVIRSLLRPLTEIATIAENVASGQMDAALDVKATGSEIQRIYSALRNIVKGLNSMADFALQIGKGKLDAQYRPLSDNDTLGNSLLQMQESLIVAQEEREKRRLEDEKRTWATFGLAKFSDILRQHSDNIKRLSSLLISNLVDYLDANQGGVFIYNDENKDDIHMELVASYAYNRQKNLQKKIPLRVGLVGMCAVEKRTRFLTDIPNQYINITSGLGDATPKSLLLVPLVLNDEIFGVIELATFKKFEKSEITFVEQLAENIASTLASVKTSQRTSELLAQSQKQSEEMATQEEEMRQNLEELIATQEEMERKTIEQEETIQKLTATQGQMESTQKRLLKREKFIEQIVEISPEVILTVTSSGEILEVNNQVFNLTGFQPDELLQKNITLLINDIDIVQISEGQSFVTEITKKDDSHFTAHCSVGVVRYEDHINYLFFLLDITQNVERFAKLENENKMLKNDQAEVKNKIDELSKECKILYAKLEEAQNVILLEQRRQESLREELEIRSREYERLKDELDKQNRK